MAAATTKQRLPDQCNKNGNSGKDFNAQKRPASALNLSKRMR